eukprot:RCo005673
MASVEDTPVVMLTQPMTSSSSSSSDSPAGITPARPMGKLVRLQAKLKELGTRVARVANDRTQMVVRWVNPWAGPAKAQEPAEPICRPCEGPAVWSCGVCMAC